MMSRFVADHRAELIKRCAAKAAQRMKQPTDLKLKNGIPLFLSQLQRTLEAEEHQHPVESLGISGAPNGDTPAKSEMGHSATAHGRELLDLGFSIDEVVHNYGDLCQAVTDLAVESDAPFAVSEFRTLNRCLDNAIANAVSAFTDQRDAMLAERQEARDGELVSALRSSMRSSLAVATYAVAAMEAGNLPVSGSTGSVLKKSLEAMRSQVGGPSLGEVQHDSDR